MLPIDFVNDIPGSTTLLSTIQKSFLPFFNTKEACTLRLVSKEFNDTIKEYHWNDTKTCITGRLKKWRVCFPNAVAANISNNRNIHDGEFVHLRGIHTLDMWECDQITDAAFVHLRGIHTLSIFYCRQITDAAFVHLRGIHTLNIEWCSKITNAAKNILR